MSYREYFPEGPWIYRPDTYLYSYVIIGLHPKTYEFRIRAFNSLGRGPWSASYVQNIELGTDNFMYLLICCHKLGTHFSFTRKWIKKISHLYKKKRFRRKELSVTICFV